jgi:hypothetical protein
MYESVSSSKLLSDVHVGLQMRCLPVILESRLGLCPEPVLNQCGETIDEEVSGVTKQLKAIQVQS